MKIYIGFDDTDTLDSPSGTGKLVRRFTAQLPVSCRVHGVIRQQLLVSPEIPYKSHNSSACAIADIDDASDLERIIEKAVDHLRQHAFDGSDPGVCIAAETDPHLTDLISFGHACTHTVMSQKEALRAAGSTHLSGHGGTNDGIIGAAAAVGLTAAGWAGRYIEYDGLRDYPQMIRVSELNARQITVMSVERDAALPAPQDLVLTNGWLRPRRIAHEPVVLVRKKEPGLWQQIYQKNKKGSFGSDQLPG